MSYSAPEPGQIPLSHVLAATLAHATDAAGQMGFAEVTLEHLLAALCDDPDAVAVMDASRVDAARVKNDTIDYLSRNAAAPISDPAALSVSEDVRRILEAAAAAARGGRRREINGAILLAAIVGDGQGIAAQILQAQGLTFESAIRALQAALAGGALRDRPAELPQLADDVLARARERVQSRATPTLKELMADMPRPVPPPPMPGLPALVTERIEPSFESPMPEPSDAGETVLAEEPVDTSVTDQVAIETAEPHQVQTPAPADASASLPTENIGTASTSSGGFYPPQPGSSGSAHSKAASPVVEPSVNATLAPSPTPDGDKQLLPSEPQRKTMPPTPMPPPPFYQQPAPNPLPPLRPSMPPPSHDFPLGIERRPPGAHRPPPIPPGSPMGRSPMPGPPGQPPHAQRPPTGLGNPAMRAGAPPPPAARSVPPANGPSLEAGRERQARVEPGQLAENIPRAMKVGVTERAEIRIAKAAITSLTKGLEGGGAAWRHDVSVTQAMSVRLRAPEGGFFIETASPETQWIENTLGFSSDDFASWRFLITPQERGWSRLQVIVSARTVSSDGIAAETALPDQVVEVKVRRNVKRALAQWSGWAAAAIVGGALARFGETGIEIAQPFIQRFMN